MTHLGSTIKKTNVDDDGIELNSNSNSNKQNSGQRNKREFVKKVRLILLHTELLLQILFLNYFIAIICNGPHWKQTLLRTKYVPSLVKIH
jgi:hypothetical protein